MTKTCSKCKECLPISNFNKDSKSKDKHKHICRECSKIYYKQFWKIYYLTHKINVIKKSKAWRKANKEHTQQYYIKNKKRIKRNHDLWKERVNWNWYEYAKKSGKGTWRWSKEYKQWTQNVYKRDKYTCQDCGKTKCKVNAHHIKSAREYPEFKYDIDNGKTLCIKCHRTYHKHH